MEDIHFTEKDVISALKDVGIELKEQRTRGTVRAFDEDGKEIPLVEDFNIFDSPY